MRSKIVMLIITIFLLLVWWFLTTLMLRVAIQKWRTNAESIEIEITNDGGYLLPENVINSECVQFVLKGVENRSVFYKTIKETSDKLDIDSDLVLSSILWEQIRISCKGVRWNLKNIVLHWTPTLFRSYDVSLWLWGIKVSTARQINKDAQKYWYFDNKTMGFSTTDIGLTNLLTEDDEFNAIYSTLLVKNILTRWELEWYDISNKPWVIWTLYNIGNDKKKIPNADPKIWWSIIDINWQKFTYWEISLGIYNHLNNRENILLDKMCYYIGWVMELATINSALYVQTEIEYNKYCK